MIRWHVYGAEDVVEHQHPDAGLGAFTQNPAQRVQINSCDYCLSAHTALGRGAGLSNDELTVSRDARAVDSKAAAALQFARAVVERRGDVRDQDFVGVRAAGYTDGDIAEIIAHVALNVFTNYFNRAAHTEIDFPLVTAGQLA
jgi:alkylhydroperoxidase family enzyme